MNGKSGKLVAPAVAFMLCAVALVGVGFAISLNSTSTADNNTVNVNGVVLDLTGDGQDGTIITGTAAVYYETVQTGANGTITYNFANAEMKIAAGNVAIKSPGNVTLTYTVTNVKILLSDGTTEATTSEALVLKVGSSPMDESNGEYTLSKDITVNGEGAVKTFNEDFIIYLDGRYQNEELPTSIVGASTDKLPAKITYNLSVSAAYTV